MVIMEQAPPNAVRGTKKVTKVEAAARFMGGVVARVYDDLNEAYYPVLGRGDEVFIFQGDTVDERDCLVLSCIAERCLGAVQDSGGE